MLFDTENNIVKLCASGMEAEGRGEPQTARALFGQAWNEASNHFERFIAAHYLARTEDQVSDKLIWDKEALHSARRVTENDMRPHYPSLYLNIAKCYEDLNDLQLAKENYLLAREFAGYLEDDGYGKMIRSGIENGLAKMNSKSLS